MQRVAVIGNGGGGKTTLARRLSARLGVPHHEVDQVQFRPDWSPAPLNEIVAVLDAWIECDAWIVDGFGPLPCIERRIAAADTVVYVDFPLWIHLWWAFKRQRTWRVTADGRERPPTRLMLKMIWHVHRRRHSKFAALLAGHEDKVVRLRRPRELRRWLEDPGAER